MTDRITYRLSDYVSAEPTIAWYLALGRNESLTEQITQISLATSVPMLVIATMVHKHRPVEEVANMIKNLSEFYQADVAE